MRKIINPVPPGGAPLNNERFNDVLGTDIWAAMESLLQSIADPIATGNTGVIVSGCKVTGAGPYNCSAGIVYLSGQFMAFPGFTAQTLPQYILPATVVNVQKLFNDGINKNFIVQSDATFQSGVPGAGQYISLTTTGNLGGLGGFRVENFINPGVNAGKANVAQAAWTAITFINGWTGTLSYRVDTIGRVNFRGSLNGSSASATLFCAAATLPLPTAQRGMSVSYASGLTAGTFDWPQFAVLTNGSALATPFGAVGNLFVCDNISYWQ